MALKTSIERRKLVFRKPAGTSRGVYLDHDVWYVRVSDSETGLEGLGECAPLPGLSPELDEHFETKLSKACAHLEQTGKPDWEALAAMPSIHFGLETALKHLETGSHALWDTAFSRGEAGLRINGLIWMGPYEDMERQIREKLEQGFTCIKLKIGALHFDEELELLHRLRARFSPEELTLRVDANGAFKPSEAQEKLFRLSECGLHSIEQPIATNQWKELAALIRHSPVPVALDEELIGIWRTEDKIKLLESLKPDFLVLKPTLHGGFSGCREWIALAYERAIGWWATSALESNIGLNAVAQWCATLDNPLHQGLGTGALYVENVDLPLCVEGERLWYRP